MTDTAQSNPRSLTLIERWVNRMTWLDGCDIQSELQQARDEGRELGELEGQAEKLLAVPKPDDSWFLHLGEGRNEVWLTEAGRLIDAIQQCPIRDDFPYEEPSDLEGIHAARPKSEAIPNFRGNDAQFQSQLHGGLLGRLCGCLLGKPIECFSRHTIRVFAEATDNWPITSYLSRPNQAQQQQIEQAKPDQALKLHLQGQYDGEIEQMVSDDDVNYTLIGFEVVKRHGADFTTLDVGHTWMQQLPICDTCTAERIAYRNLTNLVVPPRSATYRNPYREWIGAQIRADYYGYANPGLPERAGEWAWRDASLSHVRNGIYGEMWVAAMLAAAYVLRDWKSVIHAGLAQIPAKCRLAEDINKIVNLHEQGATYDQVADAIHEQWDEHDHHGWCHTNSNAQVVAMALLWGENDYETTICRSVMHGFDTDCNGATAGSLWGVMHGADAIPDKWAAPLNDRGQAGLRGWRQYIISDLAAKMTQVALKNLPGRSE